MDIIQILKYNIVKPTYCSPAIQKKRWMGWSGYGGNSHIEWVGLESNLLATSKMGYLGVVRLERYANIYIFEWTTHTVVIKVLALLCRVAWIQTQSNTAWFTPLILLFIVVFNRIEAFTRQSKCWVKDSCHCDATQIK